MPNRPKHSKKEIEEAVQFAEANGWIYASSGKSSHAWGFLLCPHNDQDCRCGQYCKNSIWSTPRSPENMAKKICKWVEGCKYANGEDYD
ncbi:hypothetical protein C0068_03165 [Zhongshania marina]|uniref:Uncharacterized protein n=1 Tax=Zhongshania marina TaxID=2304603 RepID=A0A2S4HJX0_9GAMM|nr:hypothetical protein C0068_03165 [Marortus luteolus]